MTYLLPHVLLKSTTLAHFGTSDFGNLKSQLSLSPKILLSEACDLLMHVSHRSTTMVHFRSSPRVQGFMPRVLLNLTTMIYFGSSGFRIINSQLLHTRFFLECFTRSTQSIDVRPPTNRRSPATSAIRASKVSTLHLFFLLKLTIYRYTSLWI
jgi:hypothetical protein